MLTLGTCLRPTAAGFVGSIGYNVEPRKLKNDTSSATSEHTLLVFALAVAAPEPSNDEEDERGVTIIGRSHTALSQASLTL